MEALDRQGVKRFDAKAFLLGFVIGREWNSESAASAVLLVESMYPRKRRLKQEPLD